MSEIPEPSLEHQAMILNCRDRALDAREDVEKSDKLSDFIEIQKKINEIELPPETERKITDLILDLYGHHKTTESINLAREELPELGIDISKYDTLTSGEMPLLKDLIKDFRFQAKKSIYEQEKKDEK